MTKGITITKALAGYTRVSYNGEEIAKHYLSATTQGTREAFDIPEGQSVDSWIEKTYAEEIKAIDEAEDDDLNFLSNNDLI
jgi:hypothetical protein